jgi:transposase, IS6 family
MSRRQRRHVIISRKVSQYETQVYSPSYRDLEEMMAERGLAVDHVTIWRWVHGTWTYLYRAVDSARDTIDFMLFPKRDLAAARLFLRLDCQGPVGPGHG